jgi:uncharacterized protein YjgD (DUF1641 family)
LQELLLEKLNKLVEIKNQDRQKFREMIYAEKINNTQNSTSEFSKRLLKIDSEVDTLQNRIKKISTEPVSPTFKKKTVSCLIKFLTLWLNSLQKTSRF